MNLFLLAGGAVLFIIAAVFLFKRITKKDDLLLPDLSVSIESHNDTLCAVKLINNGKGTAVIKDINFWNSNANGSYKKSIDEVFPINKSYWVNNTIFCSDKDYFLASGDSLYIGKIKKDRVLQKGGNYNQAKRLFDDSVKDIKIKVEYCDVFSHKLSPLLFNN